MDSYEWRSLGVVIAVTMLIITTCLAAGVYMDRKTCREVERQSGLDTRYELIAGCFVKVNDRYIPLTNWRNEYQ